MDLRFILTRPPSQGVFCPTRPTPAVLCTLSAGTFTARPGPTGPSPARPDRPEPGPTARGLAPPT
jgi:hypothetical protein